MAFIEIKKDNFDAEVLESRIPVILYFCTEGNPDCPKQEAFLEKIAQKYAGDLKIGKINVDEQPMLALNYQVLEIPTVILMHLGIFISRKSGVIDEAGVETMLDEIRA